MNIFATRFACDQWCTPFADFLDPALLLIGGAVLGLLEDDKDTVCNKAPKVQMPRWSCMYASISSMHAISRCIQGST